MEGNILVAVGESFNVAVLTELSCEALLCFVSSFGERAGKEKKNGKVQLYLLTLTLSPSCVLELSSFLRWADPRLWLRGAALSWFPRKDMPKQIW